MMGDFEKHRIIFEAEDIQHTCGREDRNEKATQSKSKNECGVPHGQRKDF